MLFFIRNQRFLRKRKNNNVRDIHAYYKLACYMCSDTSRPTCNIEYKSNINHDIFSEIRQILTMLILLHEWEGAVTFILHLSSRRSYNVCVLIPYTY